MPAATQKTPARKSRNGAAAAPLAAPAASGTQGPLPPDVEMARNLFNASLAPMHGWLRFMAQWRETQAELLHEMDKALGATLREAGDAADVQQLLRLQGDLATNNLSRSANAAGALFRSWLETEAAVLEQAQVQGADMTRQIIKEAPAALNGNGKRQEGGAINPAAALLTNAQTAWTQAAQQWIETVRSSAVH
jgi:hypothetical protein